MRKKPLITLTAAGCLGILALSSVNPSLAQTSPRQRLFFNTDWHFHKGDFADANPLGRGYPLTKWRWKSGNDLEALTADTSGPDWKDAMSTQDVFAQQSGFAWFRTTLAPLDPKGVPIVLRFAGVDDNATVYLNGQRLFSHQGWNEPFQVPVTASWKSSGPNELAVLVENTENTGGIGEVGVQIGAPKESAAMTVGFDDSKWRKLDLPHDWGIEGNFDISLPGETGKLPWPGVGWYHKHFSVPASDKGRRVLLEMDGAMANAQVWLNGQYIGGRPYGYISWALDLTSRLRVGGQNVLAIKLNNLPESSRWYPGSGIYRNVWLTKTAPVHVGHWGTYVTTNVGGASSGVNAKVTVNNETSSETEVRVVNTVLDAARKPVAKTEGRVRLPAGSGRVLNAQMMVPNARKWSLKDTYRYTLVSQVMRGSQVVDRYETPFGFRTIRWDAQNGFLLNGERVQLNGVCLHHDLGALGAAWNKRAAQRQLQMMKNMGVNAIRTTHNPPAPEFLEMCDSMGFVVLDEFSDTWTRAKKSNGYAILFKNWAETDLRDMIHRDRNHPSIIAWSTGNEIGEQEDAAGHAISRFLTGIVHSEDPTRPVTTGNDRPQSGSNGFQKTVDVFGYNYKPGMYAGFHQNNPTIPLYGSETASTISSRGEYFFPVTNDKGGGKSDLQMSSYDLYAPGWATPPDWEFRGQDENPFVAGEFVWTGFDYLGEPTPYNSDTTVLTNFHSPEERAKAERELAELGRVRVPSRSSYFGVVDLAGFPKDRFYIYQARWRPDFPMAHILPHWNWPERVGQVTPVHVYTSGDEAELFLNGKSLGRKKKGQYEYRLRWDDVVYEPGTLRVVAYKNGKRWAGDQVETTGAASKVMLQPDRARIAADGKDLSFVTVKIADQNGQMVPRSKNLLTFSVLGPGEIVATDNGNAIDLTAFKSKQRNAYNGLALVIVRAKKGQSGNIVLSAKSAGLASAQVRIAAQK